MFWELTPISGGMSPRAHASSAPLLVKAVVEPLQLYDQLLDAHGKRPAFYCAG